MAEKLVRWRGSGSRRGIFVFMWPLAAVVVLGMVPGCGSKSPTTSGTTVGTAAATTATTGSSATTATTGSSGGGTDESLSSFAQQIQSGVHTIFKAVYTASGAGTSGTYTIEQAPPKSLFKTSDGEVLATGSATYYCSTAAPVTCVNAGGSAGVNPLAALTQVFSATPIENAIQQAEAEAAAHTQGFNASFSTQSFGGLSSDCVTLTSASQTAKYCATKSGVLTYSGTSTSSFQLTSYSSSPSPSDFQVPAGATVQTVP